MIASKASFLQIQKIGPLRGVADSRPVLLHKSSEKQFQGFEIKSLRRLVWLCLALEFSEPLFVDSSGESPHS